MANSYSSEVTPEIDKLLQEYSQNRNELKNDLTSVAHLKEKVELLIPTEINFRNKHQLEDKLKILSSFFGSITTMRQEFNRSIIQEIEVRRKLNINNDKSYSEEMVRAIAQKIEKIKKEEIIFPDDILDEPTASPDDTVNLFEQKEK